MADPDMNEVDFEEAKAMAAKGRRLAWIGREPLDYVAGLLGVDASMMAQMDPRQIRDADPEKLKSMSGTVFICYHGVTSMHVVTFLEKRGVKAYSLRGGITSIVGEIF